MHPAPSHRTVLNWIRPSAAERYEIFSESGIPRAVLTVLQPTEAVLETRVGRYAIRQSSRLAAILLTDSGGSLIASIQSGLWGRRLVLFHDGRELELKASNLFSNRWIWSDAQGQPRAVVQREQIFFSPDWVVQEGLSSLLAGLTVYFMTRKLSLFPFFS